MNSFLNISELSNESLYAILDTKVNNNKLIEKNIGLIFEKYSTRTRLSFNIGIKQLGGNPLNINFNELNISRSETFEDTFKALSCYLDGIIYRTTDHNKLISAKKFFKKPIINALSDISHPCQALSDLLTIKENFGSLDVNILWMGDMNNVCYSLVESVRLIESLKLNICTPSQISKEINWKISDNISITDNLKDIDLANINVVMTDVFISMNDKETETKIELLKDYRVDNSLMSKTSNNSVFMHCLPAKVGMEVTDEVYRSSKSIIWKQAFNRLVAQKKLMQYMDWN